MTLVQDWKRRHMFAKPPRTDGGSPVDGTPIICARTLVQDWNRQHVRRTFLQTRLQVDEPSSTARHGVPY
jgi:hypothetical protein